MPRQLIRLLIVLAMTLAVPLQGLAAVSAGLCMAMGHHDGAASPAHDHSMDHAHDADTPAHHESAAGDNSTANTHCPPCVSCCAAASISAFPQIFDPAAPATEAVSTSPASPPGILLDGLDRPPLIT